MTDRTPLEGEVLERLRAEVELDEGLWTYLPNVMHSDLSALLSDHARLVEAVKGVEELRALSNAATPGKWWWSGGEIFGPENSANVCDLIACGLRYGATDPEDAAFIVALANWCRSALSTATQGE